MTDVAANQNIQSHYSLNTKVERTPKLIAEPPQSLPTPHLYSDIDANNRLNAINQDIYQNTKAEENKSFKAFCIAFAACIAVFAGFKAIKSFFKKS